MVYVWHGFGNTEEEVQQFDPVFAVMSMDVHRGTMRLVKYDVHGSFLDSLQLS